MKRKTSSFDFEDFIPALAEIFPDHVHELPWQIVPSIPEILRKQFKTLSTDFTVRGTIAIHKTATIEEHAMLKGPIIISKNCFVASHAYLRNGVFLGDGVSVGPGCEIKASLIFSGTALAHFNFIGDSLVGSGVNFEAGSVVANCFNERESKEVVVMIRRKRIQTGLNKFGALIGDLSRIGANAVLSPGTVLPPGSIVKRLQLVEQVKQRPG